MSLSGSRRMSKQREDGEFYLECKAAFLTIYDDIDDRIESKKTLNTLLQTTGRNPTRARLEKYWTRDTVALSFNDFVDFCKKEPVTSSDDLIKAFRKIDLNGDGYISLDELYKIMNAQGENMSRDDVRKIIDEVDENKDGRLDYNELYSYKNPVIWKDRIYYDEFTNMVMKTSDDSKKFAVKVMERKEKKKRRIEKARNSAIGQKELTDIGQKELTAMGGKELTDDQLGEGKADSSAISQSSKLGSSHSVRSHQETDVMSRGDKHDNDNLGSQTSLRSRGQDGNNCLGSRLSLRSKRDSDLGSKADLKQDIDKAVSGSRVSLRSKSGDAQSSKEGVTGSKVSLKSITKDSFGSKTSVRETSNPGDTYVAGSNVSLRKGSGDVHGSKVSVKSWLDDVHTSKVSLKADGVHSSRVSLKASAGDVSGSRASLKSASGEVHGSQVSLRAKSERNGLGSKVSSKNIDSEENSDDTIKGEDGYKTEEATNEGNGLDPKAKQTNTDTYPSSPKQEESQNSARTVGEELDYDDDFDIVSTGRPTPRVDLHSARKETPRAEVKQTPRTDNKSRTKKDDKGNSHFKSVHSEERVSSGHAESARNKETHTSSKTSGSSDTQAKDVDKSTKPGTGGSEAKESGKAPEKGRDDKEVPASGRFLDEIFHSSARSEKSEKSTPKEPVKDKGQDEKSSKDGPPPKAMPRKDSLLKDEKEAKPSQSARLNDEVPGSRTSLRSGDLGTPVPSPRKALSSRLSEDDMPRPSPRVTLKKDGKGKSPSVRGMAKLPDPKSLRDWTKFTSKGCFFYEEDEIVTHVFSLRLEEDSSVFLSAYPLDDEPSCLSLSSKEPIETVLYVFDSRGKLVTFTEQRDVSGKYGVKLDLTAGEYQVLPFTTGCRFKQRQADQQCQMKEAKLVKKDKEGTVSITTAFRRALVDIFNLCDLDENGTMSYSEFNWFNLRTSGEELEEEEWKVVEERTKLENEEITKEGFIELNEMEAEDVKGDTEDLWITLTSMGMNKALIMDEACPYKIEVYVEETVRRKPTFKVTGIESLEKKDFADEICRNILEKGEPVKVRNMKDLYICTFKNEHWSTIVVDNRSRSTVNLEVDCSKSRNVVSNHDTLDYTFEIDPQTASIAHHLLPRSELSDWTINVTETIHK